MTPSIEPSLLAEIEALLKQKLNKEEPPRPHGIVQVKQGNRRIVKKISRDKRDDSLAGTGEDE